MCSHKKSAAVDAMAENRVAVERAVSRNGRVYVRVVILCMFVVSAFALFLKPGKFARYGRQSRQLSVQDLVIALASRLIDSSRSFKYLHPLRADTGCRIIASASDKEWPYEFGTLSESVTANSGVQMPRLVYNTMGQKSSTEELVWNALNAGFRGIDTAHLSDYDERGVGEALRRFDPDGARRETLYIQSRVYVSYPTAYARENKFGEDVEQQINRSLMESLANIGVGYLDSLLLHAPSTNHWQTMQAWREMERAVSSGYVRQLGISNVVTPDDLSKLYNDAKVKPASVQQLGLELSESESAVRSRCKDLGIMYQMFIDVRRNTESETMKELARKYSKPAPSLFVRFIMGLGFITLTNPSSEEHMMQDVQATGVPLMIWDVRTIDQEC